MVTGAAVRLIQPIACGSVGALQGAAAKL